MIDCLLLKLVQMVYLPCFISIFTFIAFLYALYTFERNVYMFAMTLVLKSRVLRMPYE